MANTRSLPDVFDFPCQFCCKYMQVDKTTFMKGGVVKCKSCGMITRFKPHKNAGRAKVQRHKWKGGDPDGLV